MYEHLTRLKMRQRINYMPSTNIIKVSVSVIANTVKNDTARLRQLFEIKIQEQKSFKHQTKHNYYLNKFPFIYAINTHQI